MTDDHRHKFSLERLVFFSDAVFAIAITLLVLEIRLPPLPFDASDAAIRAALWDISPKISGFVLSFFVIAAYWEGHHRSFAFIVRVDRGLIWLNFLLLLTVSFMPFPTGLFSEHPARVTPLALYAASLGAVGVCSALLWRHASKGGRLLAENVSARDVRRIRNRGLAGPLVCALAAFCSMFSLALARMLFFAIPIAVGIGDRLATRGES